MATWVQTSQFSKVMDAIKEKLAKKLDASGIKNNLTTEDSGYVLDARAGKTLGDRATTLETKVGDLYFDTDSSGNWGFKSSKNGAVKSFTATGAASTIESSNLTASKALVSDANGKVAASSTTTTELGYLHGVTSSVQEQMNSLNSNLSNFQTGVDALYNNCVSLGVTPTGKTLAAITAALQSVYDAGVAAARCKITAVVGFVGGNPNDYADCQGKTLYGTLTLIVSNGAIESQTWVRTHADDLSGNNMYYQTAKIWSITIEKL